LSAPDRHPSTPRSWRILPGDVPSAGESGSPPPDRGREGDHLASLRVSDAWGRRGPGALPGGGNPRAGDSEASMARGGTRELSSIPHDGGFAAFQREREAMLVVLSGPAAGRELSLDRPGAISSFRPRGRHARGARPGSRPGTGAYHPVSDRRGRCSRGPWAKARSACHALPRVGDSQGLAGSCVVSHLCRGSVSPRRSRRKGTVDRSRVHKGPLARRALAPRSRRVRVRGAEPMRAAPGIRGSDGPPAGP